MRMNPFAQNRSVSRRDALLSGLSVAAASATLAGMSPTDAFATQESAPERPADDRAYSPIRYKMRKSINLWAFPYPQRMNLRECLELAKRAGFDAIELNYDLDNDLSPKATPKELASIRHMADEIGIEISGLCSFLFWPYPLSSNDGAKRSRGLELAGLMAEAANHMGVENLLVVPGAVHIPWRDDHEPVANDVCEQRAREAVGKLVPAAERLKVSLNMENIFFNGFLMTPMEMTDFVDSFGSDQVQVHFDTGNISMFQFAEHWIPILGKRIKNIHFKEFTKKGTDYSLETFRPLLDGTTNWPAVMRELADLDYEGYLTFEYFHPYQHYPDALIYQTSDSLDRMLGRDPELHAVHNAISHTNYVDSKAQLRDRFERNHYQFLWHELEFEGTNVIVIDRSYLGVSITRNGVEGWVERKRQQRWERVFQTNLFNGGTLRVSLDRTTGELHVLGSFDGDEANRPLFSYTLRQAIA